MNLSGSQTIAAPIEQVWNYLLDVRKVAACAPDFQDIQEVGAEHWQAMIPVKLGFMRNKATVDLTRSDLRAPNHMVLKASGKAPGHTAEVLATLDLVSLAGQQTRLDWQANISLTGMLASVGTGLLKSTIEKDIEKFFTCLKNRLQ
jgi:carbon monoxide dehydrogenase subunit G